MDIDKISSKEPLGETSENQGTEVSKKPTILQAGAEIDVLENASDARPALAKILEEQPVMEATLMQDVPQPTAVPFNENVKLPTELPDGNSVDPGLSAFNIGSRNLLAGPNHFGIDLSKGGISARDLIAQVLGITNQSSIAPTGGIPAPPDMSLYADGEPGFWDTDFGKWLANLIMDRASDLGPPGTGEAIQLLNAPELIEEVTGDATDGLRGIVAFGTEDSGNALLNKVDEGSKYVNPEGGPTPDIFLTPEQAMKVIDLLKNINVKPENPDGGTPDVTAEDLKGASPLDPFAKNPNLRFVADRNPDLQESVHVLSEEQLAARLAAEGPDTVNPNDPDVAPTPAPTDIPDTPRGGGTIS